MSSGSDCFKGNGIYCSLESTLDDKCLDVDFQGVKGVHKGDSKCLK